MPDKSQSSGPSGVTIKRPLCPQCQQSMSLARIEPGPPGYAKRFFECTNCKIVERVVVQVDPTKAALGWIDSDLKPPK